MDSVRCKVNNNTHENQNNGQTDQRNRRGFPRRFEIQDRIDQTGASRQDGQVRSGRYRVTRSSHRTIESITSIDRPQAATKTNHVAHIGVCR